MRRSCKNSSHSYLMSSTHSAPAPSACSHAASKQASGQQAKQPRSGCIKTRKLWVQDMLQLLRPRLTIIRLGAGKEKAPPPEETLDTFRAASGLEPAQVQQPWHTLAISAAGCTVCCQHQFG